MRKYLLTGTVILWTAAFLAILYPKITNLQAMEEHYRAEQAYREQDSSGERDAADSYNRKIAESGITNPGDNIEDPEYDSLLDTGDGIMAYLEIPAISLRLPVRHYTSDDVLSIGLGHLHGTSLPVGGKGTHAVIAGHSGMLKDDMFDHLTELSAGDTFRVVCAGETEVYRVAGAETVLPEEAGKSIFIDPEKDLVTLMTCVPYGINSHRLMITGERETAPAEAEMAKPESPAPYFALGAAWLLAAGLILTRIWSGCNKKGGI